MDLDIQNQKNVQFNLTLNKIKSKKEINRWTKCDSMIMMISVWGNCSLSLLSDQRTKQKKRTEKREIFGWRLSRKFIFAFYINQTQKENERNLKRNFV